MNFLPIRGDKFIKNFTTRIFKRYKYVFILSDTVTIITIVHLRSTKFVYIVKAELDDEGKKSKNTTIKS